MCGRYVRKTGAQEIAQAFSAVASSAELSLNFNISPTSDVYVLRSVDGQVRLDVMSWGLVPVWAKDMSRAANLINARSESVAEKPSFRNLISRHRCVMPMNAYYEWKPMKISGKVVKQPFAFFPGKDSGYDHESHFAVASLWSTWRDTDGRELNTCVALTTEANERVSLVHNRMPVLLTKDGITQWLSGDVVAPLHLAQGIPNDAVSYYPVSTEVNNARNHGSQLLEEITLDAETEADERPETLF
jgi:putative SOS response-associated peptidase YedK